MKKHYAKQSIHHCALFCFLFLTSLNWAILFAQQTARPAKIQITKFKSYAHKNIDFFCEQIKDATSVDMAYNRIIPFFSEDHHDYFQLKCRKGCVAPLIKEFGRVPIVPSGVNNNVTAFLYRPRVSVFIGSDHRDNTTSDMLDNLKASLSSRFQGNDAFSFDLLLNLNDSNSWQPCTPILSPSSECIQPLIKGNDLVLFVNINYNQRTDYFHLLLEQALTPTRPATLNYTVKLLKPTSKETLASDALSFDFNSKLPEILISEIKRDQEQYAFSPPDSNGKIGKFIQETLGENAADHLNDFIKTKVGILKPNYTDLEANYENDANIIFLSFDSLAQTPAVITGMLEDLQPVEIALNFGSDKFRLSCYCSPSYLVYLCRHSRLAEYYTFEYIDNNIIIAKKKKQ
jgi:hypothetical protein